MASGVGEYLCARNVLDTHTEVYNLYRAKYADIYGGKVGISLVTRFFYAATNAAPDIVDRAMQFEVSFRNLTTVESIYYAVTLPLHYSNITVTLQLHYNYITVTLQLHHC